MMPKHSAAPTDSAACMQCGGCETSRAVRTSLSTTRAPRLTLTVRHERGAREMLHRRRQHQHQLARYRDGCATALRLQLDEATLCPLLLREHHATNEIHVLDTKRDGLRNAQPSGRTQQHRHAKVLRESFVQLPRLRTGAIRICAEHFSEERGADLHEVSGLCFECEARRRRAAGVSNTWTFRMWSPKRPLTLSAPTQLLVGSLEPTDCSIR